jgi:hypothetical protein
MGTARYVGIENEFQIWKNNDPVIFSHIIEELRNKHDHRFYSKNLWDMRMWRGNRLYADGDEAEVCTPPVRLQQGFATQAATALYQSRQSLLEFLAPLPGYELVGYSMHWNMTNLAKDLRFVNEKNLLSTWGIPLSLFMLNPWSKGVAVRSERTPRLECMGDHIEDLEQVQATMLLYAAAALYSVGDSIDRAPFAASVGANYSAGKVVKNVVSRGRDAKVIAFDLAKRIDVEITAQEWLERMVDHYEPVLAELGTLEERMLLREFVQGKRALSIDDPLDTEKGVNHKGALLLRRFSGAERGRIVMSHDHYMPELQAPAGLPRFLGKLTDKVVVSMNWDSVKWIEQIGNVTYVAMLERIEEIDTYACVQSQLPDNEHRLALMNISTRAYDGNRVIGNLVMQNGPALQVSECVQRQVQRLWEDVSSATKLSDHLPVVKMIEREPDERGIPAKAAERSADTILPREVRVE